MRLLPTEWPSTDFVPVLMKWVTSLRENRRFIRLFTIHPKLLSGIFTPRHTQTCAKQCATQVGSHPSRDCIDHTYPATARTLPHLQRANSYLTKASVGLNPVLLHICAGQHANGLAVVTAVSSSVPSSDEISTGLMSLTRSLRFTINGLAAKPTIFGNTLSEG
ncbi:hypothetical protein T265_07771 [Opisthorchis viverrini]|uniref:Uncharacterized protein n=1 Tax=Opisthorchis viverrini TaxID=6198 RepID=A0A074ZMP4_OPIVI|nr:hypothetical protein T265_07771 [Opisthorchis viverrini]KER24630.1 hypothetical protein T265_07771 [Opisthorchis viverrini]